MLYLGKTWGCGKVTDECQRLIPADPAAVVLLDEADVFLEERSLTDLHRNALVSGKRRIQLSVKHG